MHQPIEDQTKPNLPLLRALKCAYKLHKAGLSTPATLSYLQEASEQAAKGVPLPSAALPVTDLLSATFNFNETHRGSYFWHAQQAELVANNP